jgi:hypothetical protein
VGNAEFEEQEAKARAQGEAAWSSQNVVVGIIS